MKLLPVLTELRVYDNSATADPATGQAPQPVLVLHMEFGHIIGPSDLTSTPAWAKPIVAAALELTSPEIHRVKVGHMRARLHVPSESSEGFE